MQTKLAREAGTPFPAACNAPGALLPARVSLRPVLLLPLQHFSHALLLVPL